MNNTNFTNNPRKYGSAPYAVAVIHGGPGAAGEMAPVARELSRTRGVLEPLQTADSVDGQIAELKSQIEQHAAAPVTLIGYSWGAWLSLLVAAKFPELVKKLILVSSGPFEAKYAEGIHALRMSRLSEKERAEVSSLIAILNNPDIKDKNAAFGRFGELFSKTDSCDPMPEKTDEVFPGAKIFQGVWPQADALRRSGQLLDFARQIKCPTLAIHGDYDPHPAEGVRVPLSAAIRDFKFVLLEKCGHTPWREKHAREKFFSLLAENLRE